MKLKARDPVDIKDTLVSARISKRLFIDFLGLCKQNNISVSNGVEQLINMYVTNEHTVMDNNKWEKK